MKKLSIVLVSALALSVGGLATVPAHAKSATYSSPEKDLVLKVITQDITSGDKSTEGNIRVKVKLPKSMWREVFQTWQPASATVNITVSGHNCGVGNYTDFEYNSDYSPTMDFEVDVLDGFLRDKVPGKPAKCYVTADLEVKNHADPSYLRKASVTTTFFIKAKTKASAPKAVSKVKKGKSATISGKVTYRYASGSLNGHPTLTANVAKGTPVVLQQKAKGSSKWKNVKTVKVGRGGKWATKVKPSKTSQYRVVTKKTSKYHSSTSKAKKIVVTKK